MLTRSRLNEEFESLLQDYPTLKARYQAGDPTLTRQVDAIFSALSMHSAAQEVALAEPQAKTRPATVLADAALRGIVPKSQPAQITIAVTNENNTAFVLDEGRTVFDSLGRPYRTTVASTVPANSTQSVSFHQAKPVLQEHTVTENIPFYAIEIPDADDDSILSSIRVLDADDIELEYRQEYVGISPGEKVYHVEVNANQQAFVRFGDTNTVGFQPAVGDAFTVIANYSQGRIEIPTEEEFQFEYTLSALDNSVSMILASVEFSGSDAPTLEYIRDLCRYPSLYDDDAVFLGEFEFLLKKHFPDMKFLSVWNEAIEEDHRGYGLQNTNAIFVACFNDGEAIIDTQGATSRILTEAEWTATQRLISQRIARADDTLRTRFYVPVREQIQIVVDAEVPTSYSAVEVSQSIVELLLSEYGEQSTFSRSGGHIKNRTAVRQLVDGIPALQAPSSDVSLVVDNDSTDERPELWRFVTADSITVNIETVNGRRSGWQ
jgi:hypothetical protein